MAEVPIGTVVAYSGVLPATDNEKQQLMQVPPGSGWFLCNGAPVSSKEFRALSDVLKDSHGNGKGSLSSSPDTDFNLPDYRGLFLRGVSGPRRGDFADPNADKRLHPQGDPQTGTGNSGNKVGSIQFDEVKDHTHSLNQKKHSHEMDTWDNDSIGAIRAGNPTGSPKSGIFTKDTLIDISVNLSGGGSETRPKNAYVYYIIRAK